jgi:hypothetical protein
MPTTVIMHAFRHGCHASHMGQLQVTEDLPGEDALLTTVEQQVPNNQPKNRNAVWNTDVPRCALELSSMLMVNRAVAYVDTVVSICVEHVQAPNQVERAFGVPYTPRSRLAQDIFPKLSWHTQ